MHSKEAKSSESLVDCWWGQQTELALHHFAIGTEVVPIAIVRQLLLIKKVAAQVNCQLANLTEEKSNAIAVAVTHLLAQDCQPFFPLNIWQSGSGTQTNMNVNEVIAAVAMREYPGLFIHPNDDVNRAQSTNDVFPSAIHLAALIALKQQLFPALKRLEQQLKKLAYRFRKILKVGRTHLQDAVPITLGSEFTNYQEQIKINHRNLQFAFKLLATLPLGGTAVGNGLNCPKHFAEQVVKLLNQNLGLNCKVAASPGALMSAHEALTLTSGGLRTLASSLYKIANDLRFLASGPHCGLGELQLPANEPGSSIMPGKVNPSQCEMMMMVTLQVMGYDSVIGLANAQGNFELNTFNPLIGYNLLQELRLLSEACNSFNQWALRGIKVCKRQLGEYRATNLMSATMLVPELGYDTVAQVVRYAEQHEVSLKAALIKFNLFTKVQRFFS